MKKISQILSAILCMIILFAGIPVSAEEINEIPDQYEVLKGIGIVDESYTLGNDEITVLDALTYILKIMGITSQDVTGTAKSASILPEYTDVNSALSYDLMSRLVVTALGYKSHADVKGYNNMAWSLRIYNGIVISKTVTKTDFIKIIYNVLNTKFADVTSVSGQSVSVSVGKETLLNNLGIYKSYGIMQGKDFFTVNASSAPGAGRIRIADIIYKSKTAIDNILLGSRLEFYYRESDNDDINEVIYLKKHNTKIYEISYEDICEETTASNFVYYINKKTKTNKLSISMYADVLYNYQILSPYTREDLMPKYGTVRLIDSNEDNKIDTVLIDCPDTYVVQAVDTANELIFDKYRKMPIDLKEYESVNIINNKKQITVSDIKEWSILSVYATTKSSDKVINIYVSNAKFSGIIKEINSEDGAFIYDKFIKPSPAFLKAVEEDNEYVTRLSVGMRGMFYLDYLGYIAAVDTKNISEYFYGILIATQKGKGLDAAASFKVYTEAGEVKIFTGADKMRYFGYVVKSSLHSSEVCDAFASDYNAASQKSKIIKYKINDSGQISDIITAYSTDENKSIVLDYVYKTKTNWRESNTFVLEEDSLLGVMKNQHGLASGGIIFSVPADFATDNEQATYDDDDFSIVATTSLVRNSVDYSGTEIYDADSAKGAKVIVVKQEIKQVFTPHINFIYVNKIKNVIHNDENVKQIVGLYKDVENVFYGENSDTLDKVQAGDIIQPILNVKGEIKYLKILFRFSDSQPTGEPIYQSILKNGTVVNTTQFSAQKNIMILDDSGGYSLYGRTLVTIYGNIVSKSASGLTVGYIDDADKHIPFYVLPKNLIICDIKGGNYTYRVGAMSELIPSSAGDMSGTSVFVHSRNGKAMQIVAFK